LKLFKVFVRFFFYCYQVLRDFLITLYFLMGARGGTVGEALATNRTVAGSIPDGVIGIFH
jgi:hypothetical protein